MTDIDPTRAAVLDPTAGPQVATGVSTGVPLDLRWAWYGFVVVMLTALFGLVVRQMLPLIAPALKASLGFTDLQVGILLGLGMAVFATVASYPMGWLADRYGRRLLLAIGVAIWSLATALFAFQDSFSGLFIGTIGIAIGEAGLVPIAYGLIPDLFPERKRQTANFILYGGLNLGGGLGIALGGALLEGLGGSAAALPSWLANLETWQVAMIMLALPGPLFVVLVMTLPVGRRQPRPPRHTADTASAHSFLPYARAHWRTLVCIFGSTFAMGAGTQAAVLWFPLALPRAFGIDPVTVGVGLGSAIMIATVIGMILPPVGLKLHRRDDALAPIKVARVFLGLGALPALALPFAGTPLQAYVAAAFLGAMAIAGSSLMPGLLQSLAPAGLRSRILALLGITNALALAVSPLAVGFISDHLAGPRGTLQAIGLVSVPALILSAALMWLAPSFYASTVLAVRASDAGSPA